MKITEPEVKILVHQKLIDPESRQPRRTSQRERRQSRLVVAKRRAAGGNRVYRSGRADFQESRELQFSGRELLFRAGICVDPLSAAEQPCSTPRNGRVVEMI